MPKEGKIIGKIAIVGNPNVGKSVLFNALTKEYVNVSNYPGTTVEVTRGRARIYDREYEVIDTPGMYSLMPISEEENVARKIVLTERPDIMLHVIDAKNIERMLSMTLQLIEASLPVILVLNIMDEARKEGMTIDTKMLRRELNIPIVETISTAGKGIKELKEAIQDYGKTV